MAPDPADVAGCQQIYQEIQEGLAIERRAAVDNMKNRNCIRNTILCGELKETHSQVKCEVPPIR